MNRNGKCGAKFKICWAFYCNYLANQNERAFKIKSIIEFAKNFQIERKPHTLHISTMEMWIL